MFHAILFAIHDCGFIARYALESNDGPGGRLNRILEIIDSCRYGIHDLSRIELSAEMLPRLNMAFELGAFVACMKYGPDDSRKVLVLDQVRYRPHKSLSDIACLDASGHNNSPHEAIRCVREFLAKEHDGTGGTVRTASTSPPPLRPIPGGDRMIQRFEEFSSDLIPLAQDRGITHSEILSLEYLRDYHANFLVPWLQVRDCP